MNSTPATRTTKAIRLKMMIFRAKGERFSDTIPRRPRPARRSGSAIASGETQSSPRSNSPDFALRESF
jgi:hypothetical protein